MVYLRLDGCRRWYVCHCWWQKGRHIFAACFLGCFQQGKWSVSMDLIDLPPAELQRCVAMSTFQVRPRAWLYGTSPDKGFGVTITRVAKKLLELLVQFSRFCIRPLHIQSSTSSSGKPLKSLASYGYSAPSSCPLLSLCVAANIL